MAGVFASIKCLFVGHKWRWTFAQDLDYCDRCGDARRHQPGTKERR